MGNLLTAVTTLKLGKRIKVGEVGKILRNFFLVTHTMDAVEQNDMGELEMLMNVLEEGVEQNRLALIELDARLSSLERMHHGKSSSHR